MNQIGFVEISLIKNEQLYRASLPIGVPWADVHEALLELAGQVADHIKLTQDKIAQEEAEKSQEQNLNQGS